MSASFGDELRARSPGAVLRHRDVSTTMMYPVYLHVLDRGVGFRSRLDALGP